MKDMREEFEKLPNCKTNDLCYISGRYFCDMHSDIEIYISENERFPNCNQKSIPHSTNWNKIIEKERKVTRKF